MESPKIVHTSAKKRFEIYLGRAVIGKSYYRLEAGRRVFTHTEIDPDYQGHGLASQLLQFALDETRGEGLRVIALCPTAAAFIAKRPEYHDMIEQQDA